jgi:hypothetical protein
MIALGVAGVFVVGLSCATTEMILRWIVMPAATKYTFVRSALEGAVRRGQSVAEVRLIVPDRTREAASDEEDSLGAESGMMVSAIGREIGAAVGDVMVTTPRESPHQPATFTIDLTPLAQTGLWPSFLPK